MVDPRYVELLAAGARASTSRIAVDPRRAWRETLATVARRCGAPAVRRGDRSAGPAQVRGAGARRRRASGRSGFRRAHLREPAAPVLLYGHARSAGRPRTSSTRTSRCSRRSACHDGARRRFRCRFPTVRRPMRSRPRRGGRGYALINPGAAWPNKRWPPERFGALAAAMRDRAWAASLVLWGPGEEALAPAVVARVGGCGRELAPPTTHHRPLRAREAARACSSPATPVRCTSPAPSARRSSRCSVRRSPERNGPWSAADRGHLAHRRLRVPLRAALPASRAVHRRHRGRRGDRASDRAGVARVAARVAVESARLAAAWCEGGSTLGFVAGAVALVLARPTWPSWRAGLLVAWSAKASASGPPVTSRRVAR